MSSLIFFFLFLVSIIPLSLSLLPKGDFIDCGAAGDTVIDGVPWQSDVPYVTGGTVREVPVGHVAVPTLATSRSFPNVRGRKYCYVARAYRDAQYMVRTTYYFYGGGGGGPPPVFDQTVDGTFWSVVNTTGDYSRGKATYYEGVFPARGSTISVCVGANEYTESEPFITALELVILDPTVYNTTDFLTSALHLVQRTSFGYGGPDSIRYPDDKFNRYWQPYGQNNLIPTRQANVSVSEFWNIPPLKIFETELTTLGLEPLELNWPSFSLSEADYYVAFYFAESNTTLSVANPRSFTVSINGVPFYENMNLTRDGIALFATKSQLSGPIKITLTPSAWSSLGPLINGGEIFQIIPLGGRTHTRDVIMLEKIKRSLQNYPIDWSGDPCFPVNYSWTGVTCAGGHRIRIISLNLTGMGISGTLSPSIANLTALNHIWLGDNRLSGPIPDLSSLKLLETLHLENNQFTGEIPSSLGTIDNLRELFLQNNRLEGPIPSSLIAKQGLTLRVDGNLLFSPPPPQ